MARLQFVIIGIIDTSKRKTIFAVSVALEALKLACIARSLP